MRVDISIEELQEKAATLGWDDVGVTPAHISDEDIQAYETWLAEGKHGPLHYMENRMRTSPQELLPGAKTAILFVSYYKQPSLPFRQDAGLIAAYARGRDYHHVHRKRLKQFIIWFQERVGANNIARGFSDSAPLLEKALAVQAGLGWFGKNTLLIHRKYGTYILLSGVLTTATLSCATLQMRLPRCGVCTRCLDACPTKALTSPYHLDATLCLSTHLIESKEPIPDVIAKQNPGYLFGCDICQEVCPHNVRKPLSTAPEFQSRSGIGAYLTKEELRKLAETPQHLFGTPLQRRGVTGLQHTAEKLQL